MGRGDRYVPREQTGLHNRRVHYRALSTGQRPPAGEPYINDKSCESYLQRGFDAARALGPIDPEAFVDRKDAAAKLFVGPRGYVAEPGVEYTANYDLDDWTLPYVEPGTAWGSLGYDGHWEVSGYDYDHDDQPMLVAVWIEKSR